MEHDYDIGSTIREKIVPHAVSWFTGEAIEGEEFEIDNDKDDDDDDEDDDQKKKPSILHKKGGRPQLHDGQQGERPPECKQQ
ncbi:nucleosome assembly protein 1;3-like [Brassica napus]|uniref:nucleosome assembly protein 1;3-like n=1 Tax=Brassica napus TaxID=3708 RepID=UPI00207A23EA|nr:nucleosome assembly protein 1;3-like [Brassica napus]